MKPRKRKLKQLMAGFLNSVSSLFESKPTVLEAAIDVACQGAEPDWAQNLQVCDMIESRYGGDRTAAKAVKRIKRHLGGKNVMLALTLLETTIKNCSFPLVTAVGAKSFLATLKELAQGRGGAEARERALDLVQKLGMSPAYKLTVPGFFETFEELVREGFGTP